MVTPAENQQTVEAALAVIQDTLTKPFRQAEDPAFFALDELPQFEALATVRAALRDLVAQADRHSSALTETYELLLAGESDNALHALDTYLLRNGLPLARLDGARP